MRGYKYMTLAVALLATLFLNSCGTAEPPAEETTQAPAEETTQAPAEDATQAEDAPVNELYSQFMAGKEKARYDASGDIAQYLSLAEVLTDGESYTLPEIVEKLSLEGTYSDDWLYELISDKNIDLGQDGNEELLVTIGAATYNLSLVVKDIEGTLEICFAGDSRGDYDTSVTDAGYVTSGGEIEAGTHHLETGYIDGDGDYNFWFFLIDETVEPDEDTLTYNGQVIGDNIGMYLETISFEKGDGAQQYYYADFFNPEDHSQLDAGQNALDGAYELLRQALEAEGKTVITPEEAQSMMEEHRQEIGMPEDIH